MSGAGAFFLGAARLVPPLFSLPLRGFPRWVIGLLVILTVGPKALPPVGDHLFGLIVTETTIGLALGLWAALPFFIARSAGLFVDGAIQLKAGPLGDTMQLFALALWALFDGPALFIRGLGESYLAIPVGGDLGGVDRLLFAAGTRFFSATLLIGGPILLALLLGDLLLGLLLRVWPMMGRTVLVGPSVGPGGVSGVRLPIALLVLIVGLFTIAKGLSAPEQLGDPRLLLREAERVLAK